MSTIVIAEIGENHLGDVNRAKEMIHAAAEAGVDIVKFQSYLGSEVRDDDPEKEWFTKVQISDELHFELKAEAENAKVEFLSAPFSMGRLKFLIEELNLNSVKIASSEMLNFEMLDYVNESVNRVFISTGLSTLEEIKEAVAHLNSVKECYILHCTTQYPTEPGDANLLAIKTLREAFPDKQIGFSDHTLGITAPIVAVSLGAKVIEKHITMDKSLPGTDHILSVTPDELKQMVENIREAEQLLGSPEKKPTEGEMEIIEMVRTRWKA